jgi:predicted dehydrogenase
VERGHAPSLLQVAEVEVVATADPAGGRALQLGRTFGLDAGDCYADYRSVLERRDVEVVNIATPPATHREIVVAAAQAGKQVICEKPIAPTLADADAMIEACRRHGVTLAVYHNYLYYPETVLARQLIAQGAIGDVFTTEFNGLGLRHWSGAEEYRPGWRLDAHEAGGGAFIDAGVHAVYLTEAYHGKPVEAVNATIHRGAHDVDTFAFCQLHLNGGYGLINLGWGQGHAGVHIVGTAGHLAFTFDEWAGYYGNPVRAIRVLAQDKPTVSHYLSATRGMFPPQIYVDLMRACAGESSAYAASVADARKALEVTLAAYKSAAMGALVRLPLPVDDPLYRHGWAALSDASWRA